MWQQILPGPIAPTFGVACFDKSRYLINKFKYLCTFFHDSAKLVLWNLRTKENVLQNQECLPGKTDTYWSPNDIKMLVLTKRKNYYS